MNDTLKGCLSPYRLLFLRSHGNVIASSVIAQGLQANKSFEFFQYPIWPDEFRSNLKKLGESEEIWNALHAHTINNSQELVSRLTNREFDLILLADYNGALFQYSTKKFLRKLYVLLQELFHRKGKTWASFVQYYRYMTSLPFTLKELSQSAPVIVIDMADFASLTLENLELLRASCFYFKREIPFNRFALFNVRHFTPEGREFINREASSGLAQSSRSESWKKKQLRLIPLIDRVQNIPLGIADAQYTKLKKQRTFPQDIDVLFIGAATNTLRMRGQRLLQEIAANSSWNIVIKESLPFDEYCRMIARSKITISIAGGGWDCFRHYEAVALGSVPLINKPTVDAVWWHSMPEAIFFENTFSNFVARIEQLLNDDQGRAACLATLEQQIEKHALHSKIVEYIIQTALNNQRLGGRTDV